MMGKKLLALLLCGALLVTVLAACGAPEEKEVSAEQDSQPVETEKEPDTGDASLDNPRNQDGIGEKELLVVSFGTSYNDSRRLTIGAIEMPWKKHSQSMRSGGALPARLSLIM